MPTTTQDATPFDIAINKYGNVLAIRDLLIARPDIFSISTTPASEAATAETDATNPSVLRNLAKRDITVHTGFNS